MFAYAMLGTSDFEKAVRFYDALMDLLGHPRSWTGDEVASWGSLDADGTGLSVGRPFDGRPASAGNGGMLAFHARSVDLVKRLHKTALAMGGTDEGAPGLRPQYSPDFYAAYIRDPDGNKLAFVCYGAPPDA